MANEFDPYACEIGTALWEAFRREHPEAPERPPEVFWLGDQSHEQELARAAIAYWDHVVTCGHCSEW